MRRALCLCALLVSLGGLVGCNEPDPASIRLNEREQALVGDTLQLIRLRIRAAQDPGLAQAQRDSLRLEIGEQELQLLLERLAEHPARARKLMSVLSDSLEAMRDELFPRQAEADR